VGAKIARVEGKTPRGHAALLLVLIAVLGPLLSGCLHANAALNIAGDDLVSGEVLVSTQTADGQVPFRLQPPDELADRVQVTPYSNGDRVGSHLSFHDLTFQEVEQLAEALSPSDSRYRLQLSRSGSLVIFNGSVDLTPLADTDSGVEMKISAPGEITNTNGQESAGTVNWVLEPGEVTELSATYQFASATGMDWLGWALLVGATTLAAALLVALLALRAHLRHRADQQV
jgi:phosphatidylinositol mannoside-binding LppM-like protein